MGDERKSLQGAQEKKQLSLSQLQRLRKAFPLDRPLTRLLLKFDNMLWEYRLGINSRGESFSTAESDSIPYSTIPYRMIMKILRHLALEPSDVFVDIGCGKGRVLCCASRFRIRQVVGVEIDQDLCRAARHNTERVRGRQSPVSITHAAAQECDYRAGTVYYLFCPFGAATLNQVLARIRQSLQGEPRRIRIVYVNPMAEPLLERSGWLQMKDRWQMGNKFGLIHDVSFWQAARA
ncbi:MAG TPA: class I SAM-dependent methyltransferase [Sedimentisphaerales bacterium]|nr:class I SAM-dependent methyltransferase [Sedimentisphaerales bacterium]